MDGSRRTPLRWAIAAALMAAAVALLADACSFSTYPADPATGAPKACFTAVERWLGRTQPSEAIRGGELLGAIALVLGVVVAIRRGRRGAAPSV